MKTAPAVIVPGFYLTVTLANEPGITHVRFEREQPKIEELWASTYTETGREGRIVDTTGNVLRMGDKP